MGARTRRLQTVEPLLDGGDSTHALPAAASLRGSGFHVTWIVKPQFRPLLDGGDSTQDRSQLGQHPGTPSQGARDGSNVKVAID